MNYQENGYTLIKNFFEADELKELSSHLVQFHENWKKDNFEFYSQKAVNSSNITGTKYLSSLSRQQIFKFIGSSKMMKTLSGVISENSMFMNTQLFFNPANADQKNYWHRDPQYHLTLDEQKKTIASTNVVHFRVPLMHEPGIELIPGTHKRWDTEEELDVRLERNGRQNHEDLSSGLQIPLHAGDLLVFSANMIHRGLYGMDRLALDILFCDAKPELAQFVVKNGLPSADELHHIENPTVFENALRMKN